MDDDYSTAEREPAAVPGEALGRAEELLARMRAGDTPGPGLEALGDELVAFEDETGQPVAVLIGADQAGLGAGFGDLRDPRVFLRAAVCRDKEVRLAVKLAIQGGLPTVITALASSLAGIGAIPGGVLGGAAAVVVYEGVEKLCDGG
jgi:hypothetical protein